MWFSLNVTTTDPGRSCTVLFIFPPVELFVCMCLCVCVAFIWYCVFFFGGGGEGRADASRVKQGTICRDLLRDRLASACRVLSVLWEGWGWRTWTGSPWLPVPWLLVPRYLVADNSFLKQTATQTAVAERILLCTDGWAVAELKIIYHIIIVYLCVCLTVCKFNSRQNLNFIMTL